MKPSLCLSMIVKNESHIIEETLANICQHFELSYWVVSDTGSTDHTVQLVENFFKQKNIAGEIVHEAWQDFAYNRNVALTACAGKSDYVLFFDADDLVQGQLNLPVLGEFDAYNLQMTNEQRSLYYVRRLIVRNHPNFRWKGVMHEVVDSIEPIQETTVLGDYVVLSRRKGNRNLDPLKALNDATVLEKAYLAGHEDKALLSRYAFYCAQSYNAYTTKDKSYIDKAIEWYQIRASIPHEAGLVDDEVYMSYQVLGMLYEEKKDFSNAYQNLQKGIDYEPRRAECYYHLTRMYHHNGHLQLAYEMAKKGVVVAMPDSSRIFLHKEVHQFWIKYELSVIASKLGKMEESYQLFKQLLSYEIPARMLAVFKAIVPKYHQLILKDRYDVVLGLQIKLKQLGYEHYLQGILSPIKI